MLPGGRRPVVGNAVRFHAQRPVPLAAHQEITAAVVAGDEIIAGQQGRVGIVVAAGFILRADIGEAAIGIEVAFLRLHQKLCSIKAALVFEIQSGIEEDVGHADVAVGVFSHPVRPLVFAIDINRQPEIADAANDVVPLGPLARQEQIRPQAVNGHEGISRRAEREEIVDAVAIAFAVQIPGIQVGMGPAHEAGEKLRIAAISALRVRHKPKVAHHLLRLVAGSVAFADAGEDIELRRALLPGDVRLGQIRLGPGIQRLQIRVSHRLPQRRQKGDIRIFRGPERLWQCLIDIGQKRGGARRQIGIEAIAGLFQRQHECRLLQFFVRRGGGQGGCPALQIGQPGLRFPARRVVGGKAGRHRQDRDGKHERKGISDKRIHEEAFICFGSDDLGLTGSIGRSFSLR